MHYGAANDQTASGLKAGKALQTIVLRVAEPGKRGGTPPQHIATEHAGRVAGDGDGGIAVLCQLARKLTGREALRTQMGHSESHDICTALRNSCEDQSALFKREHDEPTDEGGEDDLAWEQRHEFSADLVQVRTGEVARLCPTPAGRSGKVSPALSSNDWL